MTTCVTIQPPELTCVLFKHPFALTTCVTLHRGSINRQDPTLCLAANFMNHKQNAGFKNWTAENAKPAMHESHLSRTQIIQAHFSVVAAGVVCLSMTSGQSP